MKLKFGGKQPMTTYDPSQVVHVVPYEPPLVVDLGALADLTRGPGEPDVVEVPFTSAS